MNQIISKSNRQLRFAALYGPYKLAQYSTGAFTLVELLTVIGVIGLLIGILLPVLSKARDQAQMVTALAASRQLMQAYVMYAQDNHGCLIPGHLDYVLNLPDDRGVPLAPAEVSERWPWRLIQYIKYGMRGSILVGERAVSLADRKQAMWSYMVSLTPSFGLNMYNLGGDLRGNGALNSPVCVTKITSATQTSRRIVFASSHMAGGWQGFFVIRPPDWVTRSGGVIRWSGDPYNESAAADAPEKWGYVHPRYGGKAVVACLDGHSELLTIRQLRDMTRWSEPAALVGNDH